MITIIGRGHGGTRAISHTLMASGVFMGATINESGDGNDDCQHWRRSAERAIEPVVIA